MGTKRIINAKHFVNYCINDFFKQFWKDVLHEYNKN